MTTAWIRVLYAVLLGLVVALTFGFAVTMIDPGPKPPDTPAFTFAQIQNGPSSQQEANSIIKMVDSFYQGAYDFRRTYPSYQRNVFIAFTALAIVIAAAGLALPEVMNYLRAGLTLGAVLLLIAGAYLALSPTPNPAPVSSSQITDLLAAGSPPGLDFAGRFLRFAVAFIGLLVLLFLGIWRLTQWAPRQTAVVAPTAPLQPFAPPAPRATPANERDSEVVTPPPATPPEPGEPAEWRRPGEE